MIRCKVILPPYGECSLDLSRFLDIADFCLLNLLPTMYLGISLKNNFYNSISITYFHGCGSYDLVVISVDWLHRHPGFEPHYVHRMNGLYR